MELRVLKYFLEIAKNGNMTRAAEILHVVQPTLSKQIQDLEDELGRKLFTRSRKGLTLTEEGLILKERAAEIVALADKTAEEFKSLDEIVGGDIHIGCAEADGFKYFVRILKELQKKYPRLRCHLYSSDSESTTDKLDRGILDFAIIAHGNIDLKKYNFATLPTKNIWGLLMRKDSPLAQKDKILREDLLNIPLICSRQGLDEELLKFFGEYKNDLNIVATGDLLYNPSVMVKENFGYALGYDKIISDDELCFRPLEPLQVSPMHIIWKKNKTFAPISKMLMKEILLFTQ